MLKALDNEPKNSAVHYLLHTNAFLKSFITEEEKDYRRFREIQDAALFHFEELPDSSPYRRFCQSEAYFYSGALKAKFNELYGAARDINRLHTLVEENNRLFPEFLPNNKLRGILKVYLSTVPEKYKWLVRMLGIEEDLYGGMRMLAELSAHQKDSGFLGGIAQETAYLRSFALFQVAKSPHKAWSETLKCTKDYEASSLSTFFRSNMALKLNKNLTARNILLSRPNGGDYEPFYFLNYQLGLAKLNSFDSTAIEDFNIYRTEFKGRNYLKSCLQKMSWYYVLEGNKLEARRLQLAILSLPKSVNEEDKLADQYATKPLPNPTLLRMRLLYDGGDFKAALRIAKSIDPKKLENRILKAEYCYRHGRISEKLGNMKAALKFYEACSLFAKESEEYYGAYACIYLGDHYLKNGDLANAKTYYQKALTYSKNREYVESIEQRAKSGLKKLD
ncbi:MAG: hypothetical protein ACPGYY_06575 [Bacteroidia bacterium]